jgi:ABC-2 type transport system permease protein
MRLYLRYFSVLLRSAMQYRVSFFLTALGQFLSSFSVFLGIFFMFTRFNRVEGFTFSQVLLCFAVILVSFSTAECFARGFDLFRSTISDGEFDRIMVRPRNEMFQVLASKIEFSRVGRLLEAAVILVYALATADVAWDGWKAATLVMMLLGGTALFSGLFIVYASFCFFTIEGLEFMNIFTDGGREFGRYPMSVYGKRVLRFFTFVVPLACVQYYPLLYLLGRAGHRWYALLPLAGFAFLLPCYAFWRFGVRHYKSTGS